MPDHVSGLVFMPLKSFNKPFEFLLYKTNRLHFSEHVYCNRSQITSLTLTIYNIMVYHAQLRLITSIYKHAILAAQQQSNQIRSNQLYFSPFTFAIKSHTIDTGCLVKEIN